MRKLTIDYETFGIAPGLQAPPPACLQYAWGWDPTTILHARYDYEPAQRLLWTALTETDVHVIAHNSAFEWIVTAAWRTDWLPALFALVDQGRLHCTMIRDKLIRIGRGDQTPKFDLATTARYYSVPGVPNKEFHGRLRYGSLWDTPVSRWEKEYIHYCDVDIETPREVFERQEKQGAKFLHDEAAQVRAAVALVLTSAWGFATDPVQAEKLERDTVFKLEEYKELLLREGFVRHEFKDGQEKFVRDKKTATAWIEQVYAEQGREVPRKLPTETMIKGAYKQAGLPPPELGKRVSKRDIEKTMEDCRLHEFVGNIALDEDACIGSKDPKLLAYCRYGQADTLIKKVRRAKKPLIQTYYDVLKDTGRTSCSQGDDPDPGQAWSSWGMQMQNLPRAGEEHEGDDGKKVQEWGARECFVAHGYAEWMAQGGDIYERLRAGDMPEYCIISADYPAHEMRVWAWVCKHHFGYSDLFNILTDVDRCPHVEMGAAIKAMRTADAYALKKTDKALYKLLRNLAKGPNFGLPGGMGAARLIDYCWKGYGVSLTLAEAKHIVATWKRTYREAQEWLDLNSELTNTEDGKATVQQLVSGRIRGGVHFCEAANTQFQGPAADIAKTAGYLATKEAFIDPRSALFGTHPIAFVHDEWLFLARTEHAHAAGMRLARVLQDTAEAMCPGMIWPVEAAVSFRWSKAYGDPVWSPDKELVPHEVAEAKGWKT